MDEPFSALDVLTAQNLREQLLDLWTDHEMPTRAILMVTHNIDEGWAWPIVSWCSPPTRAASAPTCLVCHSRSGARKGP